MVKSCTHTVINYLRPPEPDQNMSYLPLITGQYRIPQ